MLVAVVSGKGSPGASTTALALALSWPGPVLLADCDPRGGDLLWGYGQGKYAPGSGVLAFQANTRRSSSLFDALAAATVQLGEDRWALPGVDTSQQAASVNWGSLARALRATPAGLDVIADCGVVPALRAPIPLWAAADLVLLANRSTLKSTRAALNGGVLLQADLMTAGFGTHRLTSVVIGAGRPYPLGEVAAALAPTAPVLGEIPWEARAAATLSDGAPARRGDVTRLTSAARDVARAVQNRVAAFGELPGQQSGSSPVQSWLPSAPPWGVAVANRSVNGAANGSINGAVNGHG